MFFFKNVMMVNDIPRNHLMNKLVLIAMIDILKRDIVYMLFIQVG